MEKNQAFARFPHLVWLRESLRAESVRPVLDVPQV
jgi:hypothetical protein